MEDSSTVRLLQQIQKENQEQNRLLRKQNKCLMGLLITSVVLCIACFLSLALLVPKAENALIDMEKITSQMAEANLGEVIHNVNQLAVTSNDGMAQALEKIDSIDLETLNKAITDLHNIVEPLSRLFSRQ